MIFKLEVLECPKIIPTEYQECKTYWQWAQLNENVRDYLIKHCNENQNTSWFTKALKAIGMRPGLPDYQYPVPNGKYSGLWIEMKTKNQKNSKKRDNQEEWMNKLRRINHYATYAYGSDDAIDITKRYIENRI